MIKKSLRKLFSPPNKIHQTDGGQAADKNVELEWKCEKLKDKKERQKANIKKQTCLPIGKISNKSQFCLP